ncbi:50S ribosomal protein L29 [Thermoplasmatales archaeon SW_10_69_26]|nr:MAG: 50S ribosomal protein L29 [Thermoplasmatales archaeon SW_10_69_26]
MNADELRDLTLDELEEELRDMQQELMHERGVAAMGGQPPDPGRIKELRKTVARIKTIANEKRSDERGTS